MKPLRILLLLVFLPCLTEAQQKPFSIGVGLIAKQDNYSFNDPGQRLLTGFFDESHIRRSIFARWAPSARWSTEVGIDFIQTRRPNISYSFPVQRVFSGLIDSEGRRPQYTIRQYYTPVSIGRTDKFRLTVGLYGGGAFTTHKTKSGGTLTQALNSGVLDPIRNQTETISGVTRSTYPNRVTFSTEAGFHVGALLGARWQTRCQVGWHQGFGTTIRSDVEYVSSFEPGITNRAVITSNGSGWSGGLSLAYLFGRRALDNVPGGSPSAQMAPPPVAATPRNHRFSIGIDGGSRAYQYAYADPGGRLLNEPTQLRGSVGLSARWYASERWTTEAGFQQSINPQKDVNFNFPNPQRYSASIILGQAERHYYVRQYYNALIVKPFKGVEVALGPHAGIGFSRFTVATDAYNRMTVPGGGPKGEPEDITAQPTVSYLRSSAWALEAGLNAHIMLGQRVHLRYQYGRYFGLASATSIGINYQSSLSPATTNAATIDSRGSGWLHSGMIAYRFGRSNVPSQRRVREE